ncbi:MAG: PIG-L deacetylase family protein [Chloroflexota bacterium]
MTIDPALKPEFEIPQRAIAIVAHPDDTEFGCSGTVAKWIKVGCEIHFVVLTSGDKGTEDPNADIAELRRIREAEQEEAARILGVASCVFLHFTDGELVNTLEMRGAVVRQIRRFKPEVIFTWDPLTRNYRMHPDHRICGQLALEAAFPSAMMPLSYPEQLRDEGLEVHRTKKLLLFGSDLPDYQIDISAVIEQKFEAIRAHTSQFDWNKSGIEERWRKRLRQAAAGFDFEYAEAFKLVEL